MDRIVYLLISKQPEARAQHRLAGPATCMRAAPATHPYLSIPVLAVRACVRISESESERRGKG
jgi:hypothetical protein